MALRQLEDQVSRMPDEAPSGFDGAKKNKARSQSWPASPEGLPPESAVAQLRLQANESRGTG